MRNGVRCPDRVKLVFWDGTGVVLVAKRLEEGQFRWPKVQDGVMRLTAAELSALLEGLDWKRVLLGRSDRIPPVRAALRDEGLRAENSAYGQS
jgi:transposase